MKGSGTFGSVMPPGTVLRKAATRTRGYPNPGGTRHAELFARWLESEADRVERFGVPVNVHALALAREIVGEPEHPTTGTTRP